MILRTHVNRYNNHGYRQLTLWYRTILHSDLIRAFKDYRFHHLRAAHGRFDLACSVVHVDLRQCQSVIEDEKQTETDVSRRVLLKELSLRSTCAIEGPITGHPAVRGAGLASVKLGVLELGLGDTTIMYKLHPTYTQAATGVSP